MTPPIDITVPVAALAAGLLGYVVGYERGWGDRLRDALDDGLLPDVAEYDRRTDIAAPHLRHAPDGGPASADRFTCQVCGYFVLRDDLSPCPARGLGVA